MANIFVSAGHGGKQPGAVSGKYVEKNYTLQIANALAGLLRTAGHTVTQNRTGDTDCTPGQAAALANKSGAYFFIEIHLNGGGGTGCEVYYYSKDSTGKTEAANICDAIAKLGYKSRGAKIGNALEVVNSTHMTGVLCECCFIDNAADMARLDVNKMAAAIFSGILKMYPAVKKTYYTVTATGTDKAAADTIAALAKAKGYTASISSIVK